jgi:hypothetical protein
MMHRSTQQATRDMDIEVDTEAARLIREQGLPEWEALILARETVRDRRVNGRAPETRAGH